ncbi:hypothetical protein ACH5RR_015853 [Cinchona calisaya]|uniref:Integrase catalytic domain-containing protein n=1 Tax=Cinchona calisaya TaxID=153742 RepID=A0ABD2ZUC7_9GENT
MTIHSDVWGPTQNCSLTGNQRFVTFIDCCTKLTWVSLMKAKSDVFSCFQSFHKMICTQFDAKVKILRTKNGTEYMDGGFHTYLKFNGIINQTSCPYTSAQNGVAERKNRHLLKVAQSLMFTMNLPKPYWGEAVLITAYLINRMPLKALNFKIPLEVLQGKIPKPFLQRCLGMPVLSILRMLESWNLRLLNVCLWGILQLKRITCVTILLLGNALLVWMLPIEKLSLTSIYSNHLFRGRVLRKKR